MRAGWVRGLPKTDPLVSLLTTLGLSSSQVCVFRDIGTYNTLSIAAHGIVVMIGGVQTQVDDHEAGCAVSGTRSPVALALGISVAAGAITQDSSGPQHAFGHEKTDSPAHTGESCAT